MALQNALSIFQSDTVTEDKLKQVYAETLDQVQKGAISAQIKNQNLSGDPQAGSVEVRRLMTSTAKAYGTARTAGNGDKVSNNGVTINIDQDKEIVEEIATKDIKLYGVDAIMAKRSANQAKTMIRDLDTAFFTVAEAAAFTVTPTGSTLVEKVEELIQAVETVSNDNVDGVDRDMLVLTLTPAAYGALRNYIDTLPNPVDGGVNIEVFHKVRVFSNHRQTADAVCMVEGAVAQPVVPADNYTMERIPLSNDYAVSSFYSYGTKAVMPDLIAKAEVDGVSA